MQHFIPITTGTMLALTLAIPTEAQTSPKLEATGLIIKKSPYTVEATSDRLTKILESKGITLFANIDHRANAANAGLTLPTTQTILFGNPKLGTPLMQCNQSIAIDLPQKILIWQDEQEVKVAYNNPAYLSGRHRLRGCGQDAITKISNALNGITNAVIKPE